MIINIRGTSGSGKSHLTREIMKAYDSQVVFKEEGRKQPIGYLYKREGGRSLAIPGHYESPCGGCDTIPNMDRIFELVRESHEAGHDVLFEGLIVNSDRKRTIQLHEDGLPLTIVTLSTPIDVCLESIMKRRTEKAKKRGLEVKPLNPRNTELKFKLAAKNHSRFVEDDLNALLLDRNEALSTIKEALAL